MCRPSGGPSFSEKPEAGLAWEAMGPAPSAATAACASRGFLLFGALRRRVSRSPRCMCRVRAPQASQAETLGRRGGFQASICPSWLEGVQEVKAGMLQEQFGKRVFAFALLKFFGQRTP